MNESVMVQGLTIFSAITVNILAIIKMSNNTEKRFVELETIQNKVVMERLIKIELKLDALLNVKD